MTEETPQEAQGFKPIKIEGTLRWATAVAGILAGGAGGYSVFATTNQVGSATLLLIGGVALLMALTGRVPENIGKDGLGYMPTIRDQVNERVVETMLASEEPEVQRAAAAAYTETRSAVEEALLRASANLENRRRATDFIQPPQDAVWNVVWDENLVRARHVNFEANIADLIKSHFPPTSRTSVEENRAADNFDLTLRPYSGPPVAVDVKARPYRRGELDQLAEKVERSNYRGLVVVEGVRDMAAQVKRKDFSASVVLVTGPADLNGRISERFEDEILDAIHGFLRG